MKETRLLNKSNKFIISYYVVMLVVLVIFMRPETSYPLAARFVYLGMILVPIYFSPRLIPAVITCFWGVSSIGFNSLLPVNYFLMIAVVLLFLFIYYRSKIIISHVPWSYIVLFLFTLIISVLYYDYNQIFLQVLFLFLLLYPFLQSRNDVFILSLSICIMSFALAIIYLLNFRYFSVNFGQTDYERGAWGNLNVIAGAISCGFPISLAVIMGIIKGYKSFLLKVFLTSYMILISMVLFSAASRGAIISASISSLFVLFSVRRNLKSKIIVVVVLSFLLLYLYTHGYMDLFIYRLTELDTSETVGGRTEIWVTKLTSFFSIDIPTMLLGMGRNNCNNFGIYFSTHNDFVTSIVAFGFLGFILFSLFMLKPLFIAHKKKNMPVFALWTFIFLESIVLEPFFRGYIPFYSFYILLLKHVSLQNNTERGSV